MHASDKYIIGKLWAEHEVKLHPNTFEWGGSWAGATPENPIAYDPWLLKFAYGVLMDMDSALLIDVGANTGSFSLLPLFIPGLRCLAFEPYLYEILRRNVALNNLQARVSVSPFALSDKFVKSDLWYPDDHKRSGRTSLVKVDGWNSMTVRTATLNSISPRQGVSLVKIDVEGWEPAVLRGGEVFLRDHAPALIVEHKHAGWTGTAGFLEGLGYQVKDLGNHRDFYAWRKPEHAIT